MKERRKYSRFGASSLITFADLVKSGLLDAGDVLVMTDRHGVEHESVVRYSEQARVINEDDPLLFKAGQPSLFDAADATKVGQIETLDGSRFDNPTGAARHVAGVQSVEGWKVWRTIVDRVALEDLRWRLRVRRIPEPEQIAISKWIWFRLNEGQDPDKHDEQAIDDWLNTQSLASHTVTAYRGHLLRWFRRRGSDHDSLSPLKRQLDERYDLGTRN